ncbi:MAG: S1C family serine protease [Desulfosalsimonas sp.]
MPVSPFGFSHTVTTGVISATNRSFKAREQIYRDFIQTDASINPGNSGGPLLNINGELIGINTAIYRNAEGIGFAIPINRAEKIVSDLIDYGEVVHAWIGLLVQDIDRETAEYFSLDSARGILVQAVMAESPADKAGIREGDIVVSIQGKPVERVSDYQAAMRGLGKGDLLTIKILRSGSEKEFKARAALFPRELASELAWRLLGVKVAGIRGK